MATDNNALEENLPLDNGGTGKNNKKSTGANTTKDETKGNSKSKKNIDKAVAGEKAATKSSVSEKKVTPESKPVKKAATKAAKPASAETNKAADPQLKPKKAAAKKKADTPLAVEGTPIPAEAKTTTPATTTAAPKKTKAAKPAVEATAPATKSVKKAKAAIPVEPTTKNVGVKSSKGIRKIVFQLRFQTVFGQSISVTGNHALLGNNDPNNALPLQYFNEDFWIGVLTVPAETSIDEEITYNYILHENDGTYTQEWGDDKIIKPSEYNAEELLLIDSWNHPGYFENSFYTEPFKQVLLRANYTPVDVVKPTVSTHIFRVKAPLLNKGQVLCLLGSVPELGAWDLDAPLLMSKAQEEDNFTIALNLSEATFPISYKYGIYDTTTNAFVNFEDGNNRVVYDSTAKNKLTILSDGFAVLPNNTFKGAGVAIPVFSLRSNNSFGVGEFNDLRLMVDWAKKVGLKLVQLLPVNDTTATHTAADSYPYAAISAFALHPLYLHLPVIIPTNDQELQNRYRELQSELQQHADVDYVAVMQAKLSFIKQVFPGQKKAVFGNADFKAFFNENAHWLVPYAAFCYLRDQNNTSDFNQWSSNQVYNAGEITAMAGDPMKSDEAITIHYFTQYHLHLQLKAATAYAHENGIIVKGDIPIGIYRNSCDAWQEPKLYNMDMQAGAPPDDFAVKGQNWGFPTYNWRQMQEDGFTWWKRRFAQMSYYFDAFRIDHILGFFRIWSIPMHAVEGIMGHFVPALPAHINEFTERGLSFDRYRFTQPYITDDVLFTIFGTNADHVRHEFLQATGYGNYALKEAYNTQRKVEAFIAANPQLNHLKEGLFDLISNVILFEAEGGNGNEFHFRISMEDTLSFQHLDFNTQQQLRDLYINYFYRRQDHYWEIEAMKKLPELKRSTNMLICGEDLGMVPDCVPGVMSRLGILSLEIQRMPKDPTTEFFHPNNAPYLSVVTPSTHDMSTIRGWWEEDRARTQVFYNTQLGQWGPAPYFCEPWINKAIVLQHLFSPAMWSIFQLQDILGMSARIRRENPAEERINIPADPKHYWRYRMHLTLEFLMEQDDFNTEFVGYVKSSGR